MTTLIGEAVAAMAVGLLLFVAAVRWPGWMSLGCITVAACYDLFNAGTTAINIGVSIYLLDLACIALVGIALLHLARYPSTFPLDAYPCIALFVLLALNFARGVALYGPKEAGNMSRNLFFFVAPALALMLLRPVLSLHAERLVNLVVWSGLCLTAVALLRWTHVLPVISETWDGFREVPRVLPSDYAIPVGLAFIAAGYRAMAERKGSIWWMTAGLLGGVTLALQHRSVWVATILGFAWLVLRTLRRMSPLRLAGIALSGILGLGIITVATPKMLNTVDALLTSNIRETEKSDSTWEWRVRGYDEAYERLLHSDLTDILVGPPAGVVDNSGGSYASRHIHSRYVDTFANYGIVGLVTLLLWFTLLWRRLRSAHAAAKGKRRVDASVCLEALFIAEVIYLIPYFGGVAEGSFLGLLWVAAQRREVATLAQVSRARGYLFRSRQDAFGRRSGDDWVKQSGLQGR